MSEENQKANAQATTPKSDSITIKKDNLWKYSTFVLVAIVLIGGFVMFSGDSGAPTGAVVGNQPAPSAPAPSATAKVDLDKLEHILGDADAPVTLVEWTDYECPFCGRHFDDTYSQIKSQYVDTGKIKLAIEDFPLSFHQQAQKAAEATECAAKVGGEDKFWEMHNKLFKGGASQLSIASSKKYAGEIGLNQADFDSCLDSGETAGNVQADFAEGQAAGVRGTPGFAIVAADGTVTPLSGAQPFAAFDVALKAAGA